MVIVFHTVGINAARLVLDLDLLDLIRFVDTQRITILTIQN